MRPNKELFKVNTKENLPTWNKTCADEVINVVQSWLQSDGETYGCC